VYCLEASGRLTQLDQAICFPNGIGLSPDNQTLYLCEHRRNRILRYAIEAGPSLSVREVFCQLDSPGLLEPEQAFELGPDGLFVDGSGDPFTPVVPSVAEGGAVSDGPAGVAATGYSILNAE
jgi:gluconolactonase